MTRLLVAGTVLAGTLAAATPALSSLPAMAEPGGMILIGAGLVLTAIVSRQKLRSRS